MRKLAVTVHVQDPETGRHVVFHRGAEVPDRLAEQITNPDVWEAESESAESQETEVPDAQAAAVEAQAESTRSGEPPRSGRGSSREAWAAYAADHSVHVDDEDTRDDIITALALAGVIEE